MPVEHVIAQVRSVSSRIEDIARKLQRRVATAEAGAVRVTVNGRMRIKQITIDPDRLDVRDIQRLEADVAEAVNAAVEAVQAKAVGRWSELAEELHAVGRQGKAEDEAPGEGVGER
jgi:DNA-binding YbaB/EbfC family protein